MVPPHWLDWSRRIQALSQTGLAYSDNGFDTERYQQLMNIAAEILESHTGLAKEPLVQDFLGQLGYATPKVDVRGAMVREGRILLVQEQIDQHWAMPGGWADIGDSPSEVVVREVWEETGLHVTPRKLIGVFDANRQPPFEVYHAYKLLFLCDIDSGTPGISNETLDVGFFPFDDLPPLSLNRTSERNLAEVQAHLRDSQRAAAFD
ncbi:MAG TPA: NUDIX hydrolase N-terminal domain-containing protein [Anaerolineae bacterium]|nr:NUDIX hydrolase N-terminal domain-containing protein [Anaerolineae bacterium]